MPCVLAPSVSHSFAVFCPSSATRREGASGGTISISVTSGPSPGCTAADTARVLNATVLGALFDVPLDVSVAFVLDTGALVLGTAALGACFVLAFFAAIITPRKSRPRVGAR